MVRGAAGTWTLQSALDRRGLGPVAGVDEAGRGACAGPLVVASCILRPGDARRLEGLTDSKLLTEPARDRMYDMLLARALDFTVVVVPPAEIDLIGVHVANIEGMRRAIAQLTTHPGYVLVDGFRVPGLTAPSLSVVKGDQVAACVAAASVLAKVTRDRIMTELHGRLPRYRFDVHKGYATSDHTAALRSHGPCVDHRWSYANVAAAAQRLGLSPPRRVMRSVAARGVVQNGTSPGAGVPESGRGGARIR
ncbi:MAG: ribonuclease HII [Kutzneria sp.]|nr:ribonuclease HII [Kutzneria sp.]